MEFRKDIIIPNDYLLLVGSTTDNCFKVIDPLTSSVINSYFDDLYTNDKLITFFPKYNNFLIQSNVKNVLSYYNFEVNKPFFKSSTLDKITCIKKIYNDLLICGTAEGYIYIYQVTTGKLISKFRQFEKQILNILVYK